MCPIRETFGWLCPGCGGTHAAVAMLHGQFAVAWQRNALVVALLPFAAVYLGLLLLRLARGEAEVFPRVPGVAVLLLVGVTAVFSVVRNLPL